MDSDVAKLVADQRLEQAAELASVRGDPTTASALFERACRFESAADEAFRSGDFARSLSLAAMGSDEEAAERAFRSLVRDPLASERTAFKLERQGDNAWAARLFESIGKPILAAQAYERSGNAVAAAKLLEAAGEVASAARALEAQARKEPERWDLHVALGALLLRHGKTHAGVRVLQKVPESSRDRRAALSFLRVGLDSLGLPHALIEAEQELAALGGPLETEAPESPPVSVRARVFGRYAIVGEVASSPSARVLECIDSVQRERVAVKIFAAYDARGGGRDALARFEREVRVLGTLDHPNVVPLRDYIPEGPALVLAWMSHGTLEQMLAREPLAPARAVEIALGVLAALGEAHRLGVIHRDIKPANVLFDDAGVTRLGDFGVAHLSDLSATATAGVLGTFGYMSPEQREGRPAGVRSDLYSVGVLLWEMLTGERPDARGVEVAPRTRPSGVHRDLDARHDEIVLAMVQADPEKRPENAFVARRALESVKWPATMDRVTIARVERLASDPPAALRLVEQRDGTQRDTWLDRRVVTLALDTSTLARASAFARADHPALQAVLRVDRSGGLVWLAPPRGAPLVGALTYAQAATLREALERLHATGAVHGRVDAEHVRVGEDGSVMLTFSPTPEPLSTTELDYLALARLSSI